MQYPSPAGNEKTSGYLVRPANATGKLPTVLVVHENRGLNPHMDHRGVITQFNPAAERIFEHTQAAAVGRDLADLLIPMELRDAHREGLRRYLGTGVGPCLDTRVQTSAYHADGHEFPVEVSITRVTEESPPRFTGFVRDQTARVRAEQEKATAASRAERAAGELPPGGTAETWCRARAGCDVMKERSLNTT